MARRLLLGLACLIAIGWLAGELWISASGSLEREAMRTLAEERTQTLITAARVITWAGSAYLLVPLALGCCLMLARAGMRREALAVALSLGGAILICDLVKLLTSRPRPAVEHLQAVTGSSFPSGHTTQASAFWLSLALAVRALPVPRRLMWIALVGALLLALGVAWSRVYLGVHYPSDVIAGMLLGVSWALFVAHVLSAHPWPRDGAAGTRNETLRRRAVDTAQTDDRRRRPSTGDDATPSIPQEET